MFNKLFQEEAMSIIDTHFPHLGKFTSLLINNPTVSYYYKPDWTWKHFLQEEGWPQGFPFSPVFSALVLHTIIHELYKQLRKRAQIHKLKNVYLDDKEGGTTNLLVYINDLNAVVPHKDRLFYYTQLKTCKLNRLGIKERQEQNLNIH